MRRSLTVAAVVAAVGVVAWLAIDHPAVDITVERGGTAYLHRGWSKSELPETIFVRAVGSHTVVRIANKDSVRHHLGLFDVNPGDTQDFIIAYAGTFGGFCSTHAASKQLVYVVE